MKILITGDFVVTDKFKNKDLINENIKNIFKKADYSILNLEAPICSFSEKHQIVKTGPNLRVSEEVIIPILKSLKVDLLTLANNHILDYGSLALQNTFKVLSENLFDFVGAGNNYEHAKNFKSIKNDEVSVAIVNFCENEWSTTLTDEAGANPIDIVENSRQIKRLKNYHDKVICIIHGGHQLYNYPSPKMQQLYRFYIEQGADAIICHHTHCIGGLEIYQDAPIAYSLGNFLFTLPYRFDGFHEGIIAELNVKKNEPIVFCPQFVKQNLNSHYLTYCTGEELAKITKKFNDISMDINDKDKLAQRWNDFIALHTDNYLKLLSANSLISNKYLKFVLNKLGITFINKNKAKILLNLLRCEAHNELSIEVLKKYLKINQ